MNDENKENYEKEDNQSENEKINSRVEKNSKESKPVLIAVTKEILEWIYCIVIAVVLAVLIKYYVGTPTVVKQSSMYPTLEQYDRLLLSRLDRTAKKLPKRGQIITFEAPTRIGSMEEINLEQPIAKYENEPKSWWDKFIYYVLEIGKISYIKRVIALPGEHVELKNEKVYINGEELKEDYLNENVRTPITGPYFDFVVPENCVFAMGDNRGDSTDCRELGCIPLEKIESKVVLRFFPFNKFGKVK